MIGYVTIGTNDLDRAAGFYDEVLGLLGGTRLMPLPKGFLWGVGFGRPMIGVTRPFDDEPSTVGNGMMIALIAKSPEVVDQVHAKALELGGADEGAPGPRGEGGFYGGYFRDLDGNKLVCFHMRPPKKQ